MKLTREALLFVVISVALTALEVIVRSEVSEITEFKTWSVGLLYASLQAGARAGIAVLGPLIAAGRKDADAA